MKRVGRPILSLLTAAFVLLCNVYCACGGMGGGTGDRVSCHTTGLVLAESSAKPCHDPAPSDQGPEHQEHHGQCSHCHPAPAGIERNDGGAGLAPALALDVQPPPACGVPARTAALGLASAVEPSPPQAASTLLSLHCAHNT